jgi:hypothetical protein
VTSDKLHDRLAQGSTIRAWSFDVLRMLEQGRMNELNPQSHVAQADNLKPPQEHNTGAEECPSKSPIITRLTPPTWVSLGVNEVDDPSGNHVCLLSKPQGIRLSVSALKIKD